MYENVELEKKLQEEIEGLKDVGYVMFEKSSDKAIAQVKHFNGESLIAILKVDQVRKLEEILAQEAPIEQDKPESPAHYSNLP